MQYGNTTSLAVYSRGIQFKSYYVVWKPQGLKGLQYVDRVFKSYYVVWKQKYITIDFEAIQFV